jgi:hypothetical protein
MQFYQLPAEAHRLRDSVYKNSRMRCAPAEVHNTGVSNV